MAGYIIKREKFFVSASMISSMQNLLANPAGAAPAELDKARRVLQQNGQSLLPTIASKPTAVPPVATTKPVLPPKPGMGKIGKFGAIALGALAAKGAFDLFNKKKEEQKSYSIKRIK